MSKYKSAHGLSGVLMLGTDDVCLRVYDKKGNFKDYTIYNWDIEVTITDDDAYIYEDNRIDYSKETLDNE